MSQTTLSIRMDETVKKQFDAFCSEVGMNTSVAINLFVKTVLRERRIPFEIGSGVPSRDEMGLQLLDIINLKNIPHKAVEVNAEGHIIVDKDKDPELYDWAVNG